MKSDACNRRRNGRTALSIAVITTALVLGAGVTGARLIPCLSGFVHDPDGMPVDDADLDFTISATGQRIITPGDNTDGAGFYTVCVLPNVYDVSFAPPPGTRLMGRLMLDVDLSGDHGAELDVVLERGNVVNGVVRGGGIPVGDVDVDVDDVAGGRIYTPDDNSDPVTGEYRVVVPSGLHRFRFEPPPGSRWRGAEVDSIDTSGDVVLDVDLVEGVLLHGSVTGPGGAGAFDVDVDLRDGTTGAKIFVANNATDPLGDYSVAVPTGTFQLRYAPPLGSRLIAVLEDSVSIAADTAKDVQLDAGSLLGVVVRDPDGAAVPDADLDVKVRATGFKVFTPHDRTDAAGRAEAALPAGVYDLVVNPPAGSRLSTVRLDSLVVSTDAEITIDLPEANRVLVVGRVLDGAGAPVPDTVLDAAFVGGDDIDVFDDAAGADGSFAVLLPQGELDLTFAPPRGARLRGLVRTGVVLDGDADLGDVVLETGHQLAVNVRDEDGSPVPGADLDVFDLADGGQVFTPFDDADASGTALAVLASGNFRVVVTPPTGSGLAPTTLEQVTMNADETLDVELGERVTPSGDGPRITVSGPNPFRDEMQLTYSLPTAQDVSLEVYDLRGRLVRVLASGRREIGDHDATWDGRGADGARAPSGTYVLRLSGPGGSHTASITAIR